MEGTINKKIGRPTKFKSEFSEQLVAYFDVPPNKQVTVVKSEVYDKETGKVISRKEEYKKVPNELPTLYKFSKKIGIDYTTLLNWVKKGEGGDVDFLGFFDAYRAAKELYKEFIITNGLLNLYNSGFAIFVAKNTTDMKDKTESDVKVTRPFDLADLLHRANNYDQSI